jgi:hypothetical protein
MAVIFYAREIAAGTSQQFNDLAEPPGSIKIYVRPRMVIHVLTVNHGCPVDFADRRLDFPVGFVKSVHHIGFLMYAQ